LEWDETSISMTQFRQLGRTQHLLIEGSEDFERRRPPAINASSFAVRFFDDFGNSAGPVKVEVRIEILTVKLIDCFGVGRGDMAETHVFANDRTVFAFHKAVVPRPSGS